MKGRDEPRRALGWWAGALLGCAACAHPHAHFGGRRGAERGGISVTGSGEARGVPDLARTNVGVEVRAPNVEQAVQQANALIANLLQVLKAQGIADADLRTQGFSVSYDRDYLPPRPLDQPPAGEQAPARSGKGAAIQPHAEVAAGAPPVATRGGYLVTNTIEVTVRDLDHLGAVLASLTGAGANNLWGIAFDIEDKRPLIEKARAQAVERAKADAARVAQLSGVKLGPILEVNDGVAGGPVQPMFAGAMRAQAMDVPIERGELTVTHQVSLRFAIAPAR